MALTRIIARPFIFRCFPSCPAVRCDVLLLSGYSRVSNLVVLLVGPGMVLPRRGQAGGRSEGLHQSRRASRGSGSARPPAPPRGRGLVDSRRLCCESRACGESKSEDAGEGSVRSSSRGRLSRQGNPPCFNGKILIFFPKKGAPQQQFCSCRPLNILGRLPAPRTLT